MGMFDDLIPAEGERPGPTVKAAERAKAGMFDDLIKKNPGITEDILRTIVGTPGRVATGLAGLPVDLRNLSDALSGGKSASPNPAVSQEEWDAMQGPQSPSPINVGSSKWLREQARKVPGGEALTYEPTTLPGKIVGTAADFATGGATVAPRLGMKVIPKMAAAGAVTEGAGQALDKLDPRAGDAARLLLSLAGGHVAMAPMGKVKNAARILGIVTEGVDPATLRKAVDTELFARMNVGVPLVGGEALGAEGGRLQNLTSNVAALGGTQLDKVKAARQGNVEQSVKTGLLPQVSPYKDPGIPFTARAEAADPHFAAAAMEPLPPNFTAGPAAPVQRALYGAGEESALGQQLKSYLDKIMTPQRGEPGLRVGPVAQVYRETREGIMPNGRAVSPADRDLVERQFTGIAAGPNKELGSNLEGISPNFRKGMETYRTMSPQVDAAEVRSALDKAFESALQTGSTRMANPSAGAQFAQAVRGRGTVGSERRAEFDDKIRKAGAAKGLSGEPLNRYVDEINKWLDVYAMTGTVPGMGSQTAGRLDLLEEASRNRTATAIKHANPLGGSLLGSIPSIMHGTTKRATLRLLDEILASPNATERIIGLLNQRSPTGPGVRIGGTLGLLEMER